MAKSMAFLMIFSFLISTAITFARADDKVWDGCGPMKIIADHNGNLWSAGCANDQWIVRRSDRDGLNWSTVDKFSALEKTFPYDIVEGPDGTIVVVGETFSNYFHSQWIARASKDQGQTWTVIDTGPTEECTAASSVSFDSHGRIFVAGTISHYESFANSPVGIVRTSADQGKTWSTAELPGASGSTAIDSLDHVYVFTQEGNHPNYVNISEDHGQTWTSSAFSGCSVSNNKSVYNDGNGNISFLCNLHERTSEIFHSVDSGKNWNSGEVKNLQQAMTSVDTFSVTGNKWTVSGMIGDHWGLMTSMDGGAHWDTSFVSGQPDQTGRLDLVSSVITSQAGITLLFMNTDASWQILKSQDQGRNWSVVDSLSN